MAALHELPRRVVLVLAPQRLPQPQQSTFRALIVQVLRGGNDAEQATCHIGGTNGPVDKIVCRGRPKRGQNIMVTLTKLRPIMIIENVHNSRREWIKNL